ncbi:MAG TPA: DUF4340 domain-containing protein [Anaeromyxobacteraceae bacterium]|nr:DUF4340 domain-containing protein [Anaeromyxobacteraceae bacterium]
MRAGSRQVLLLAVLAALLAAVVGAAIRWVARPEEAASARAAREGAALPFRPGDAQALVIATRGGTTRRLEGEAAADLLGAVSRVRVRTRLPPDPAGLAGRGLDPPAATLTVELRGGGTLSLDVGDVNPFDGTRFGRRDGAVLVLDGVPDALLDPSAGPGDRPARGSSTGPAGG